MGQRDDARAATRKKVVEAAEHLFGSRPYHEVTIRDVAKDAGLTTGSVFSHFASKAEVFEAAMGYKPPTPEHIAAFLSGVSRYLPEGPRQMAVRLRLGLVGK